MVSASFRLVGGHAKSAKAGKVAMSNWTWKLLTGLLLIILSSASISVVFSEAVSAVTLSSSTFKLLDNTSNSVSGSYSLNGSTVTFTPTDNLSYFRDYSVLLTIGIQDTAGNALSSASSSSFKTLGGVVVT
ncbi:MAG: Ig-like domain-containing protein, partial [SAR324 cluster bacterium]|nr:Ig-like domain-containing protein [SAR324 cluster bacterium]